MVNNILNFIGLVILIWLFVQGAAPIQWIKKQFNVHNGSNTNNVIKLIILKLINCSLCSGFWFGLAYYQSLEMAAITGLSAELFHRLINKVL